MTEKFKFRIEGVMDTSKSGFHIDTAEIEQVLQITLKENVHAHFGFDPNLRRLKIQVKEDKK